MAGNSFGTIFTVTTFGESHGKALGCVVDGVPPGITIKEEYITSELEKRKPKNTTISTSRIEADSIEILSGIENDISLGTPIAILIRNTNIIKTSYSSINTVFRPGHADFSYFKKYGIISSSGGGRASGRETVGRVAAGAIAKIILSKFGINIKAYTIEAAGIKAHTFDLAAIDETIMKTPDKTANEKMITCLEKIAADGDSAGGIIECKISNLQAGIGEPVFDKLNAVLSHAVMSIGAIKGIEFGSGFNASTMKGSEHNDIAKIMNDGSYVYASKNSGGTLGGISCGDDITFRCVVKPVPSIKIKQNAFSKDGKFHVIEIKGRHDVCLCPRIVPVIEAMAAITIVDLLLQHLSKQK